jgi:hypothetical protein
MLSSVNALSIHERTCLTTITEMTSRLAVMCDPRLILQDVSQVTRHTDPKRHATGGALDKERQTISPVCASGIDTLTVVVISVLRTTLLKNMPEGRALRLRDASSNRRALRPEGCLRNEPEPMRSAKV